MVEPTVHCSAEIQMVPVGDLKPHPKNRNKHPDDQIERLAKILEFQGWRYPVKVSKRSGYVTSGHGRIEAAKFKGWTHVPVSFQDYDSDEQEYADVQADNAIASWAELDLSGINAELADLGPDLDIDLLGIKDFVVEPIEKIEPGCDEDAVPEHVEPKTKLGDVYHLGRHRLMCGDSTSTDAQDRLLSGAKIAMVYTDPPYGMGLETDWSTVTGITNIYFGGGAGGTYERVKGDAEDFSPELINAIFQVSAKEVFIWGADYFSEHLPDRNIGSWVVWDKCTKANGEVVLEKAIGSNFELCWSKQRHKRELARIMHKGLASVEKGKRVHPTQKPVALAEWFFSKWGEPTDTVLDLFGGSGSTLIACEKTNRRCFMMELDPRYTSVIIERWKKFTGKEAYLLNEDGTQTAWSDLNEKR